MALKDYFNRAISYFDTEEASEIEEVAEQPQESLKNQDIQQVASTSNQSSQSRVEVQELSSKPTREQTKIISQTHYQSTGENMSTLRSRQEQLAAQSSPHSTKTTIALKYPKRYEDATEIVDLLIDNECVLIDFQYMLDAQARRCLDFVDGASRVLSGNLQKVGASMYLLTPINVIVDVEEMGLQYSGQDINFDFDMKRR
ncbi:cell division protein SepF [Streptococcus saliviloxodontae]|uniref:Cell division protein SepF n=1 Tax=Streptococcus saliviloxodontae TaxID=1349416 RepID=A0ABS2PIZ6_9STRE|nr:cell division protein SepF [Streptococcus saliviloxodontae]MBM7635405.1 cell division inhibitor SepF [Streptococcus saliviloxodontae]